MSKLSISDKTYLEGILNMQGGYVLDFSNASFSNFFGELGIDIYDNDTYPNENISNSKAYRLRAFWKTAPNEDVARTLHAFADYLDAKRLVNISYGQLNNIDERIANIRAMATKLTQSDGAVENIKDLANQASTATIESDQIQIKIRQEIYDHIKPYLDNKDYYHSVDEAYKVVRQKLAEITGHEKATDVFNMNAESNRYHIQIFGNAASPGTSESDFFRGVGYLQLAVQFLRNEKSHALASELERNLALHYISLASLSYDLITRVV